MGFATTYEIMYWVRTNISFVDDAVHYPKMEYWQSPVQTYTWGTGDCEDYVILAMYLIHRTFGRYPTMVIGTFGRFTDFCHAWMMDEDGTEWEVQGAVIVTDDPLYVVDVFVSYEEAIERSSTTHKLLASMPERW